MTHKPACVTFHGCPTHKNIQHAGKRKYCGVCRGFMDQTTMGRLARVVLPILAGAGTIVILVGLAIMIGSHW